jgi:hypothetical protein
VDVRGGKVFVYVNARMCVCVCVCVLNAYVDVWMCVNAYVCMGHKNNHVGGVWLRVYICVHVYVRVRCVCVWKVPMRVPARKTCLRLGTPSYTPCTYRSAI